MNLENSTLYYSETCPFCKRVLRFMEKANITCNLKSTDDNNNAEELIKIGGKKQVPCLVTNGEPLYESVDIITHLNALL